MNFGRPGLAFRNGAEAQRMPLSLIEDNVVVFVLLGEYIPNRIVELGLLAVTVTSFGLFYTIAGVHKQLIEICFLVWIVEFFGKEAFAPIPVAKFFGA